MNQAEFAKLIGVSKPYVTKLIQQGQLNGAFTVDSRGRRDIDPNKAQKLLDKNSDPARPTKRKTVKVNQKEKKKTIKASGILPEAEKLDFAKARTINEQYKAALKKLQYEAKKGQLVDADKVEKTNFDIARKVRDQCLAIADRCAPLVAAEPDTFKCKEILLREISFILDGLSKSISAMRS